jgi:pimeloyl-ACP methyl ester carboxylesterase
MTTLMLLPGLNCDAAVWAPQVAALQGQARCVVPAWGLRDSLTAMAEQVLAEAPTERFAPQRVERLALLSTGTHPLPAGEAGEKEKAGRMALLGMAREQGMRAMAREWAKGMVHPARVGSAIFEQVLDMFERGSADQFAAQIQALLQRPDAAPLLPAIPCPTLVLTGRQDSWSGPAQHEAMAAAIPGAQLTIVEDSGHMCTLEQPQVVSEALAGWLRR